MSLRPRPLTVRAKLTLWYASLVLAVLLAISGLSYALLRRSLMRDLDVSLQILAQVVRDTEYAGPGRTGPAPEAAAQELLGLEYYDTFFQILDPQGGVRVGSRYLGDRPLPLSAAARRSAAEGRSTFESVQLPGGPRVRLLTLPIVRDGHPVELVRVGTSLLDTEQTLLR